MFVEPLISCVQAAEERWGLTVRVAVVGSCRAKGSGFSCTDRALFEAACRSIGQRLAERQDKLILAHPDSQDSAEYYAREGFRIVEQYRWIQSLVSAGDPVLKGHIDAIEMCDAVVLIGGASGTMTAGLAALRAGKMIVPIAAFGGATQDLVQMWGLYRSMDDELRNLRPGADDWTDSLTTSLDRILSAFPRVLIIHGRGDSGAELKTRIETESGRPDSEMRGVASPVIMNLAGLGAVSVPGVFETTAEAASAAIAIVTADDIGGFARLEGRILAALELRLLPRARENIWVEVGWCWARFGRERVFIWLKDSIDLPTDLQGVAWTQSPHLDGAWENISRFLNGLRTSTA